MILKHKIETFYQKIFKISILDIALCGMFVGLWIVSSKFIGINLGFMRFGIIYGWVIIIGLIFKPWLSFLIALIADNLTLIINNFGVWMWEYAIIYPLIALLVSLLKNIFKSKNDLIWASFVTLIVLFIIIFTLVISIIYRNFAYHSPDGFIFNSWFVYILIWTFIGVLCIGFLIMMIKYFKHKNPRLKVNISLFAIIALVIIIFVWIWGPLAQVRYLALHLGRNYQELLNNYDLYLIPRILKTPIILPVYFIIVSSVYYAYNSLNFKFKNKW